MIEKKAEDLRRRLQKDQFVVSVVGEFNRGKSTLINALIGLDLLPMGILPTTATINVLHYAEHPEIVVHYRNGDNTRMRFGADSLRELSAQGYGDCSSVKYIEIGYPSDILKNEVILVDTPGVNDIDEQRTEVT